MKSLVNNVKKMSLKSAKANNNIEFLDHSLTEPTCQKIINTLNNIDLKSLGISGNSSKSDNYHFQKKLNRVTIEGNDDYRLVMFFIKKGTQMPIHDHPNMSVYFKLMFGKLNYTQFDKIDDKYKYNQFSNDEYEEILTTKKQVHANKRHNIIEGGDLLLVRPSSGNMHKFIAEEDSCFFDICLPNYTTDSLRRITYFNEISQQIPSEEHGEKSETLDSEQKTILEYYTTPPVLPTGFDIADLEYRGEYKELGTNYHL